MKPTLTSNGYTFFSTEQEAMNTGRTVSAALFSCYYGKAAVSGTVYNRDSDEYHVLHSEYDYQGFVVKTAILNLTQHSASSDQLEAGVVDLEAELKDTLTGLITFAAYYTKEVLVLRANKVVQLVKEYENTQGKVCGVMIGGMPSFMPVLESALKAAGYNVGYACSDRVSVDQHQPDGSVRKINVFKHVGFYWA